MPTTSTSYKYEWEYPKFIWDTSREYYDFGSGAALRAPAVVRILTIYHRSLSADVYTNFLQEGAARQEQRE